MPVGAAPPPKKGLSLYANLLDPSAKSSSTISSAPVTYTRPSESSPELDEAAKKQQDLAASLRFQPTKRPQLSAQKAKAKAIASKFSQPIATSASAATTAPEHPPEPPANDAATSSAPAVKSSIADWTATASDDEWTNLERQPRQRGGRKKRKKNRETEEITTDWNDIYDPSRPNNYDEYKNSEEKIREVREWKDLLYRHRMRRRETSDYNSDTSIQRPINRNFAPPPSFAPPATLNDDRTPPPPPPPPPADLPDDPSGEDAYLRRMRLSQQQPVPPPPPPPPSNIPPAGRISRAPVRYSLPPPPEELPSNEAELEALASREPEGTEEEAADDQPRSTRPGQKGFAERLLSKYGWSKGQGLGAQGTGIVNPLYAKIDKRKKKPDAEGGGYATPVATAKILGGNKTKTAQAADQGKFGAMSEVVRLEGMLRGMDLDAEITRGEGGGIMQEIGEECAEKYGSVQRVYIHDHLGRHDHGKDMTDDDGPLVFVAFVSQLSALRAVNALEGRVFNGNPIRARFWSKDWFDEGRYV